MSNTKKRIITGAVMVAVFIPIILIGGKAVDLLLIFLSICAGYEATIMLEGGKRYLLSVFSALAILLMTFVNETYLFAVIAAWLLSLFTIRIVTDKIQTDEVGAMFMVTVLVGLAWREFERIFRNPDPADQILYILIAVTFCDVGAWFFGRMFGKHPMAPTISPKKTWEGSLSGYACGAVFSLIYALIRRNSFLFPQTIFLSLLVPIAGELGDLAFSCIKREFHVKDFGTILPGHGGILDRFDSLTFALLVHYIVSIIF